MSNVWPYLQCESRSRTEWQAGSSLFVHQKLLRLEEDVTHWHYCINLFNLFNMLSEEQ